jgi:hypothetical protein
MQRSLRVDNTHCIDNHLLCCCALLQAAAEEASRDQLLDAVTEHFATQEVDESEVIACFLSAVKRHRMGLPR